MSTSGNGAQVHPLTGGGAIVSLHGSVNPNDRTVGAGCQQVGNENAGAMPSNFPGGGNPRFVATCDLTNVRIVEGRLQSFNFGGQGWLSSINLPTNVTAASNSGNAAGQGSSRIFTGNGGDRITGSNETDTIDAGGAPYKGQEAFPPSGTVALDDPNRNIVDGGGGNDTFLLSRGTGRDVVTGGTGTDLVTYADRFTIGPPGSAGVHVTLEGQANDGDPNIDQLDATALGEGDNIGADIEDLSGTKREDRLIGNGLKNVLFGDEGVDTLTAGSGEDTVIAREPAVAGSGTPDAISCGSPTPLRTTTTVFGVITTLSGIDKLEADLADPKPADCELLVDMAVDEPAPIKIANRARRAGADSPAREADLPARRQAHLHGDAAAGRQALRQPRRRVLDQARREAHDHAEAVEEGRSGRGTPPGGGPPRVKRGRAEGRSQQSRPGPRPLTGPPRRREPPWLALVARSDSRGPVEYHALTAPLRSAPGRCSVACPGVGSPLRPR